MKCIVRNCPNDSRDGQMDGSVCVPCGEALRGVAAGHQVATRRIVASVLHIIPTDTERAT